MSVIFRTRRWTAIAVTACLLASALSLGDAAAAGQAGDPSWPWYVAAAVFLLLAIRALRLAVIVTTDTVVIRSWFRTRRIPLSDVVDASAVPYDGMLAGVNHGTAFSTLRIDLADGSSLTAMGLVDTAARGPIHRYADLLRLRRGLPPRYFTAGKLLEP